VLIKNKKTGVKYQIMKDSQFLGIVLFVLGILIIAGYGLYYFAIEDEIPLFIRAGVAAIILGIVVILISLIRERLMDLKKEEQYKPADHKPLKKITKKARRSRKSK
jgi:uncharacterized integral membrane protein